VRNFLNNLAASALAISAFTNAPMVPSVELFGSSKIRTSEVLDEPIDLPTFTLIDQKGQVIEESDLLGQWHLVFFGFTHCPDICPFTLSRLGKTRQKLAEEREHVPRIVLISVDPQRDTPAVLALYLSSFEGDVTGITGDLDQIRALANALGIFFEKTPLNDQDYSVDHSAAILLVSPNGQIVARIRPSQSVEDWIHDLRLIMGKE
jgi:protein SCO1/2